MLTHNPMTTILPVKDLNRARDFYENALGLQAEGLQADGKFLLRCGGGARIALFPKADGTKAEHTALSFLVEDIVAEIRELKHRGVQFHDYELPGLMTLQHVCVLGSEKAAWFSDTEGNVLCLHEERAARG
ncbi:MAG TPA: VOC family protein [Burkholderiales bacterium]|nr:VOC family protein [Burkholderiales bacterium]